jgi:hypothetical protein
LTLATAVSERYGGERVPTHPEILLLTTYYCDADVWRRAEFVECLSRDAANTYVDGVHVMLEDAAPEKLNGDAKLRLVELGRRATCADLFDYANAHLSGPRVAIANTDIPFATNEGLEEANVLPEDDAQKGVFHA